MRGIVSSIFMVLCAGLSAAAQATAPTVIYIGPERPRLAVSDFKATTGSPQTGQLNLAFNQALWNELDDGRRFEMVAKKFYPAQTPGQPEELNAKLWAAPPTNAGLLVFGSVGVSKGKISVQGWAFNLKNQAAPQVLSSQYEQDATPEKARLIANLFAGEIRARLGSGGSFQNADFGEKYGWYVDGVKRRVQQNWLVHEVDAFKEPRRVCIEFAIMRDGTPRNVHVVQSSGEPSLDNSAMHAIEHIDSFGKLPEGDKVTVDFWFDNPRK